MTAIFKILITTQYENIYLQKRGITQVLDLPQVDYVSAAT